MKDARGILQHLVCTQAVDVDRCKSPTALESSTQPVE